MKNLIKDYFQDIEKALENISVTMASGDNSTFHEGLENACSLITNQVKSGRKIIFIGNGASASIASHMSTDFWKNGGMRAIAFNDSSLLTCVGNDYGYKHVFEKPIEMFADDGDALVAISSSGKSENILRGVEAARGKKCKVITMSGFMQLNPLSKLGDINFYVPSNEYGPVEILHTMISHSILDIIMKAKNG